jgi:Ser/Thr protein kinase RdoA (MazF antagonist)
MRRARSFLKSSLGVKSEHQFQDTVEEHAFLRFFADTSRHAAVPNSRVSGTNALTFSGKVLSLNGTAAGVVLRTFA